LMWTLLVIYWIWFH